MNNPFKNSDTNKRYYSYDYYNRMTFGRRMYKIPITIGVTCPNRDGTKGVGGCIFCSSRGSGNGLVGVSVTDQISRERRILESKGRVGGHLAYFQSYTNTYGDIDYLKGVYNEALEAGVDGIIIGTRADSLSDEVLELLDDINSRTFLKVELGLQSSKASTLELINRCESIDEFVSGYRRLREHNIKIGIHIIDSLPYESYEDMMNTARFVSDLRPDFVKIHALNIIRGTKMERLYNEEHFHLLTREEYINIVCDQLEILDEDIVIERLTGDGIKSEVIAPLWTLDKLKNLNGIDKELAKRESYQGIFSKK